MTAPALDFLQSHRDEMVGDLRRLVELESPSRDISRLAACASFLAGWARTAGATVEIHEAAGGNRHLRADWRSADPADRQAPVLLLGHYDTVWPAGTIETMPFTVDGTVARGPGAFDMKAGLVQGLWAVRAQREVLAVDRPLIFLVTSDEEIGSGTSRELIESAARDAAAVLVLEPSQAGAVKTARKGVGSFQVAVTGRAAHAGLDPDAGISAVEELARLILDIYQMANPAIGTTINVGVISGGTRPNVVAAEAVAEVDVRFSTQSEADRVSTAMRSLRSHRDGIELRVTGGANRPPLERTAASAALYQRAKSIAGDLGFPLAEVAVGGGSDGNFCAAVGATVLDGLGAVGGGAHARDEHVLIDAMPLRAALVCGLLVDGC